MFSIILTLGVISAGAAAAVCEFPRPLATCNINATHIDVVVVTYDWRRESSTARATAKCLKSLIMATACPIHLHIVCHATDCDRLDSYLLQAGQQIDAFSAPSEITAVMYSLYPDMPMSDMTGRWNAVSKSAKMHGSGQSAFFKFYLDEFFPHLDRVLTLDVDTLVAEDVQMLYRQAVLRNRAYGFAPNTPDPGRCELNGGVAVLNLAKIRALGGSASLLSKIPVTSSTFTMGEQSIYQNLCSYMPEEFHLFGYEWNYSYCHVVRKIPRPQRCYAIAHFNCHNSLDEFSKQVVGAYARDLATVEQCEWSMLKSGRCKL